MKHRNTVSALAGIVLSGLATFAQAEGRIIQIDFSGPDDPVHPNVVQITIEGGFSVAGCDATYAAIRNDSQRQHMIRFALAAFESNRSVNVVLNPNDKYYPSANAPNGRCAIARISNR